MLHSCVTCQTGAKIQRSFHVRIILQEEMWNSNPKCLKRVIKVSKVLFIYHLLRQRLQSTSQRNTKTFKTKQTKSLRYIIFTYAFFPQNNDIYNKLKCFISTVAFENRIGSQYFAEYYHKFPLCQIYIRRRRVTLFMKGSSVQFNTGLFV